MLKAKLKHFGLKALAEENSRKPCMVIGGHSNANLQEQGKIQNVFTVRGKSTRKYHGLSPVFKGIKYLKKTLNAQ